MLAGLLDALLFVAALACPLMMWLGRRGLGPGCAMMGCTPQHDQQTIETLRGEAQELTRRLAAYDVAAEATDAQGSSGG